MVCVVANLSNPKPLRCPTSARHCQARPWGGWVRPRTATTWDCSAPPLSFQDNHEEDEWNKDSCAGIDQRTKAYTMWQRSQGLYALAVTKITWAANVEQTFHIDVGTNIPHFTTRFEKQIKFRTHKSSKKQDECVPGTSQPAGNEFRSRSIGEMPSRLLWNKHSWNDIHDDEWQRSFVFALTKIRASQYLIK